MTWLVCAWLYVDQYPQAILADRQTGRQAGRQAEQAVPSPPLSRRRAHHWPSLENMGGGIIGGRLTWPRPGKGCGRGLH